MNVIWNKLYSSLRLSTDAVFIVSFLFCVFPIFIFSSFCKTAMLLPLVSPHKYCRLYNQLRPHYRIVILMYILPYLWKDERENNT